MSTIHRRKRKHTAHNAHRFIQIHFIHTFDFIIIIDKTMTMATTIKNQEKKTGTMLMAAVAAAQDDEESRRWRRRK